MPRWHTQERRASGSITVIACICLAGSPLSALADLGSTLSGGAGIDYQTGPNAQSYRGALLFATAQTAPGDLTVVGIRYEDSRLGPGVGALANAGVSLASPIRLRVIALRAMGDRGFDSWRLRAGPELLLRSDATLGAYYLRLHDDSPETFDAAGLEASFPLSPRLSAQAGSSHGRWSSGETTTQGTLAGTFRAGSRVLLLGEVDVGRNVMTTSTTSSSAGGIWSGLPLPGQAGSGGSTTQSQTDRSIASTIQLGVRFLIP